MRITSILSLIAAASATLISDHKLSWIDQAVASELGYTVRLLPNAIVSHRLSLKTLAEGVRLHQNTLTRLNELVVLENQIEARRSAIQDMSLRNPITTETRKNIDFNLHLLKNEQHTLLPLLHQRVDHADLEYDEWRSAVARYYPDGGYTLRTPSPQPGKIVYVRESSPPSRGRDIRRISQLESELRTSQWEALIARIKVVSHSSSPLRRSESSLAELAGLKKELAARTDELAAALERSQLNEALASSARVEEARAQVAESKRRVHRDEGNAGIAKREKQARRPSTGPPSHEKKD